MIVSINQPAYLPWAGYFDRIAASDLHIVLDHVQFEKNSTTNRNKIRTKDGWCWLTVPLKTKGQFGQLRICDLGVDNNQPWPRKHFSTLKTNYSRAPHFEEHESFFASLYSQQWPLFAPLARTITDYLLDKLAIRTPLLFSSGMEIQGEKSDLILNLCRTVNATTYLSGPFGRDYLDRESFHHAGIDLLFHEYTPEPYHQIHHGFEPNMSMVDMLFNCGPETVKLLSHGAKLLKK